MKNKSFPFSRRHIGPEQGEIKAMLSELGFSSLNELTDLIVPKNIKIKKSVNIGKEISETDTLEKLKSFAKKNKIFKSHIGMGYYDTILPSVIKRNVLENPGWYTQYTPYQAEISQGRLEALLNYQTMVSDLTGFELSNASLLDEATAAAEAMMMFFNINTDKTKNKFLVCDRCHPQTIDVLITRSEPLGIELHITNHSNFIFDESVLGILVQYPDTEGYITNFSSVFDKAKKNNSLICVATDLLALTLLKTPCEMGADVAIGSAQRFGTPMGYGGPHAAFFATKDKFKRKIPGRIIGLSKDIFGKQALRMALQTREQHIRREKATSNICTAQVLLAIVSGMYAVYHGSEGLIEIAKRINNLTNRLAISLKSSGYKIFHDSFFDTIRMEVGSYEWRNLAIEKKINFRDYGDGTIGISIDETTSDIGLKDILFIFNAKEIDCTTSSIPVNLLRKSKFLENPVFRCHRTETKMMRYLHQLEMKDLSLNTSMIPLGSCTMKLNSATEMEALSWPSFVNIHPFAPIKQTKGYQKLIKELNAFLIEITGFDSISMQPNSGSQGEYAGLLLIRAYHLFNGNSKRNICLIPTSAHGTNPASAVMAGMRVVPILCDEKGNISLKDLMQKMNNHSEELSAVMLTYPSTHGVFEPKINEICNSIHEHGAQVYFDGANLNAMLGLCKPGEFGCDVMHINLHKTFCIPHGGGGPGMGPIVCKSHLSDFLPNHSQLKTGGINAISPVSSAPFGSSSILPISWAYISMMGGQGLKKSTQIAILNANYMAKRLESHFPVLYRGATGYNAHEFIIDLRTLRSKSGISDEDVAKRLMDYGFHAPTMSWPVPGTLMIEPTESESKEEMDRFCDAMISIKNEIIDVVNGKLDQKDNPLKNAPHTAEIVSSDNWNHIYPREKAVYPLPYLKDHKYWPTVSRIDNAYGDRNLICSCPSINEYGN